jgi:hypothetical protein
MAVWASQINPENNRHSACRTTLDWFQSKEHNFGNRWEGLFGQNQGSPAWELRSFVASVEPYPMDSSVDLRIRYYVQDSTEAFIRAQSIKATLNYLMEPKPDALKTNPGWRDFGGWPTKDVLIPKRISSGDLGMLIRLGADSNAVNLFAPGIIYHSGSLKSLQTYRFDFFTVRGLAPFSFDVIGTGYRRTYENQQGTGDRSTVPIVFDASKIPEGWTRVILSPNYEGSNEKLDLEWKFYNKRLP